MSNNGCGDSTGNENRGTDSNTGSDADADADTDTDTDSGSEIEEEEQSPPCIVDHSDPIPHEVLYDDGWYARGIGVHSFTNGSPFGSGCWAWTIYDNAAYMSMKAVGSDEEDGIWRVELD